jgi:tRNA-2-methylthio-N6-dimethylallyladenosine synthase
MNVRDSEALLGLFLEKGYKSADNPKDADVILLNTCAVRAHAEHRVRSILGSYKKLSAFSRQSSASKKNKAESRKLRADSCKIIGLIGCMAANSGKEIFERMPHVNLIVSPAKLHKIPAYIEKIKKENIRIIDLEDKEREEDFYNASYRVKPGYAQVVISTGCSNYCSYCVVPSVRGELRLRKPKDIIAEVKRNVSLGIKKITLLGQNVNDYRDKQGVNFVDLLKMVEELDGVEEIDFLTPHPKNTTKELFKLMAKSKKIRKYLHLPYQSGSDKILRLMHRGYTKKEYLALVDDYKTIVGGTIGTDIIVGFPTETEEDFLHTKDILEKVRFMGAYIFKYSPRPGTHAQKLKDDVPQRVKEKRHAELLELQKKISNA